MEREMINTGGEAFPLMETDSYYRQFGMTLRDWLAGQALNGLLSNPKLATEILKHGGAGSGWIEDSAVAFADGMIEELGKLPI